MTTLTVMPSGQVLEAAEGMSLLDVLTKGDIKLGHACKGDKTCNVCHIFVHAGRKGLSRVAREENETLDAMVGVSSKSRLACQAVILGTEDVQIEILGFDSGL
ncbi:ferredoxin, 2Fe-2S type, ISC system [Azorhizobium oxalatiphilum]|uniref:Ferredoxin, 2Fe-2S type, ISC system n=1 Tax=Azorhizobium oxalatiphilum TaxID=980631 RepID=A0A917F7U4_9HYPH|nr:2Fe-2S iron-sulfur cluster-binding protein [Azorhizobium oxalatiphilum]GGF51887.1 ferredoxin, 2Fe-2S type, ISC system [Azorhizobium oxalatiphilum]